MNTPTFSLLHATYQRPEKAVAAMHMWFERATRPEAIEYIFACNEDDPSRALLNGEWMRNTQVRTVTGPFAGSAPAWDAAAKASTGLVLIQAQDDVEPPHNWDRELYARVMSIPSLYDSPAFIAVSDGYRKDKLCCTAIMTRARYEQCGEFIHPGYISVFSDDDATIRAYADAAAGKCSLIEARYLVFLHRHHYHDKSVPMDATYERENSSKAYAHGQALFMKRNADLVAKGFKTW